jgi:aryl-alcohol dehydrogenase-like predicted oxidoreductase
MQDAKTPEEEVVRALDELVREGKINYFGASNYAAYRLVESLWAADHAGTNGFVTLQAQYSLIERNLELEHIPALRRFGLGLLPYSPLGGGFLTGKYQRDQDAPQGTRLAKQTDRFNKRATERNWTIVETLVAAAKEIGATPSQVALAWLLRPTVTSVVTSVILGVRSVAQLDDGLKAIELSLPSELASRLDEVSSPSLVTPYDFLRDVDGRW